MGLLSSLERFSRVFESLPGLLLSRRVVTFFVVDGGGAVGVGSFVVELGGSSV
jgi:hypothetical protein